MKYHHKALVRWDDLDAMGHVNNARYLTLAQEARFEWSYGQQHKNGERPGIMEMVVARAEIDYFAAIFEGLIFVDVSLWVTKIGNSSFTMVYEIRNGETLCARITTVQVAVDETIAKSRPLDESEREFLTKYFIPTEERK